MTSTNVAIPRGRFYFEVVREIGRGGFGIVEEIEIVQSNSPLQVGGRFARKRLNVNFQAHPEARDRFEREIAQIQGMGDVQGIVAYRGQNLPGEERFYVMPVYPKSLRHFMAAAGARPWQEVAGFCANVAASMAGAHGRGFIHRDLKPENILLDANNAHVIADWGLGYFMHQHSKVLVALTRGGMGSEYYCSFEQWASGKCDATGDIYSLGMMAAELTMGAQVSISHQGAGINGLVVVEVNEGAMRFNQLLQQMTSMIPTMRPRTMFEVARRFRACL